MTQEKKQCLLPPHKDEAEEEDGQYINHEMNKIELLLANSTERQKNKTTTSSATKSSFLEDETVQYVLLFAGVKRPSNKDSKLWYSCYYGWRLFVLFTVVIEFVTIFAHLIRIPPLLTFWYFFPVMCGTMTASFYWIFLPSLIEGIEGDNHNFLHFFSEREIRSATKLSIYFIGCSMGGAILGAVLRYVKTNSLFDALIDLCMDCAVSPILGCVLLSLSLETCIAKKEVLTVVNAARDATLTRKQYLDISFIIRKRALRWTKTLGVLTLVAVYNSVGLIVSIHYTFGKENIFHHGDDDMISEVEIDYLVFIGLIQQTILLLIVLFMVMGINDTADSVTSILVENEWCCCHDDDNHLNHRRLDCVSFDEDEIVGGGGGGREPLSSSPSPSHEIIDTSLSNNTEVMTRLMHLELETRRAHLILLTTSYAVKPEALDSWFVYLTLPKTKPISFTVYGLRITRRVAIGVAFSLFVSAVTTLVNSYVSL
jgi:hypothetical protein